MGVSLQTLAGVIPLPLDILRMVDEFAFGVFRARIRAFEKVWKPPQIIDIYTDTYYCVKFEHLLIHCAIFTHSVEIKYSYCPAYHGTPWGFVILKDPCYLK